MLLIRLSLRSTTTESADVPFQTLDLSFAFSSGLADAPQNLYQEKINQEGDNSLTVAWRLYAKEGNLEAALEELRKVAPGSESYEGAQTRLEKWPRDWASNQTNLEKAKQALDQGDVLSASTYIARVNSDQEFWKLQRASILSEIEIAQKRLQRDAEQSQQEVWPDPSLEEQFPEITPPTRDTEDSQSEANADQLDQATCQNYLSNYLDGEPEAITEVGLEGGEIRASCKELGVSIPEY
jgi:hypothetical protein